MAYTTTGASLHTHEPLTNSLIDVGIFRDTLLPTLGYNLGIYGIAYGIGRATNTVATKDVVFPVGVMFNSWWSAVGRRCFYLGLPFSQAIQMQSRPEKLLLGGVTLWGAYKLAYQEYKYFSRDSDDPQYEVAKREEGFWNKALVSHYLPDALASTLIALPFTAPFRHQGTVMTGYHPVLQSTAVGLFAAGFTLEVLANVQYEQHKAKSTTGVGDTIWSVLSQPKSLASTMTLLSFPILLYSSDMLAPIELLGPLAYYLYARYTLTTTPEKDLEKAQSTAEDVKDDKVDYQKEAEEKKDDIVKAVQNKWVLMVLGVGTAFGIVEGFVHGPF